MQEDYISDADAAASGITFQLESQGDGTCLDAGSADTGNGGKIFQREFNSSDSFQLRN